MKFAIANREKVFKNLNDSGEDLKIILRGVTAVATRQKIVAITSEMFGNNKLSKQDIQDIKDGKKDISTDMIVSVLGKNIAQVHEIVSELIVDWDATDEDGNKLPITPDMIGLVLGDVNAMTLMTGAITAPTKAEKSAKPNSSPETSGSAQ